METPAGDRHADAIAAVDGVDMIAVGANDLTAELGIPGQHDHPSSARRSRRSPRPAAATASC